MEYPKEAEGRSMINEGNIMQSTRLSGATLGMASQRLQMIKARLGV
jgi:hypothetical protein